MPNRRHNRGEWSEPYVALRIIGDGKLYLADEEGNRVPDQWLNIIEVIRHETTSRIVKYRYNPNNVLVNITLNGNEEITIPAAEFMQNADILRNEILQGQGAFEVSENLKAFFERIQMRRVKARNIQKSDIFLSAEDPRNNVEREMIGFSIKSKFGKDPTLFNTGKASAAIYKLSNMDDTFMDEINSLVDNQNHAAVSERCRRLIEHGCSFEFMGFPIAARAGCKAFEENLDMINPRLMYVFDFILRKHFLTDCTARDVEDMVNLVIAENPCNLIRPEEKYPYMIKAFLYASYCGLTAGTLWDGRSNVNGGFIAVNEQGEVTANFALESEAFKSYLFKHCYFEWPATSEGHGNYAMVYKDGADYYFRLNFQIRYR